MVKHAQKDEIYDNNKQTNQTNYDGTSPKSVNKMQICVRTSSSLSCCFLYLCMYVYCICMYINTNPSIGLSNVVDVVAERYGAILWGARSKTSSATSFYNTLRRVQNFTYLCGGGGSGGRREYYYLFCPFYTKSVVDTYSSTSTQNNSRALCPVRCCKKSSFQSLLLSNHTRKYTILNVHTLTHS